MSSSTSDLSLFSSFDKESADQPTSIGLHTATSNPSGVTADTALPRPGSIPRWDCCSLNRIVMCLSYGSVVAFGDNFVFFGDDLHVKKVKYVDLYSASSWSASNALPLPVSWRWSPQANPTARHSVNTARARKWVGVSCDMPVYCPSLRRVLIQPGQAQAE